jgi:hypothetical protein
MRSLMKALFPPRAIQNTAPVLDPNQQSNTEQRSKRAALEKATKVMHENRKHYY